jgi:hypothetical protein
MHAVFIMKNADERDVEIYKEGIIHFALALTQRLDFVETPRGAISSNRGDETMRRYLAL